MSELDSVKDSTTITTLTPGQNRTDVDFGYQTHADVTIEKSHSGEFQVGQTGMYAVVVHNLGPAIAAIPTVTDVLPNGLSYVSAAGTGATCSSAGQTLTCALGSMAVGAFVTIDLTIAIAPAAAPGVVNTASVASPTFDPILNNNTDSDPTTVPLADLSLSKQLEGSLTAKSVVSYVLEATNHGPSPSGGDVIITDTLPEGLTFVEAGGDRVACVAEGQVVTCRTTGPMAVGETVQITIRVRVSARIGQLIVNSASVSATPAVGSQAPPGDPVTVNNSATAPATVTSAALPRTGAAMLHEWIEGSLWAIFLGVLAMIIARRRRTPVRPAQPP